MEIAVTSIQVERTTAQLEIHHLTDTHIDSPDYARDLLEERVAHIKKTPNAYWIHGGDIWSLILHGDKRFNGVLAEEYREYMHSYPDRCLTRAEETFGPIADKCMGIAAGNHEATVGKHYHRNLAAELSYRLGLPAKYLGDRGWVIMNINNGTRRMTVKGYVYHGWSSGRLKGRKLIQAERDIGAWQADFLLLGHDHQPIHDVFYTESVAHNAKKGDWHLRHRPRVILNGGSWGWGQKMPSSESEKGKWKTEDFPAQSWVEGKNFRPQPPVVPYLILNADFGSSCRSSGFGFDVRYPTPSFDH